MLREVRQEKVGQIVVGGDLFPGRFIPGNGDREVLAQMRGVETSGTTPRKDTDCFSRLVAVVAT